MIELKTEADIYAWLGLPPDRAAAKIERAFDQLETATDFVADRNGFDERQIAFVVLRLLLASAVQFAPGEERETFVAEAINLLRGTVT